MVDIGPLVDINLIAEEDLQGWLCEINAALSCTWQGHEFVSFPSCLTLKKLLSVFVYCCINYIYIMHLQRTNRGFNS